MTHVRFFRSALFIPFVIPILMLPLWYIPDANLPKLFGQFVLYSSVGLIYLGLPYLLFLGILWRLIKSLPVAKIILICMLTPLFFSGILFSLFYIFTDLNLSSFVGFITFAIGYIYAILILLLFFLGRRLGFVDSV